MSTPAADRRTRYRSWWRALRPELLQTAEDVLGPTQAAVFGARADGSVDELFEAVDDV